MLYIIFNLFSSYTLNLSNCLKLVHTEKNWNPVTLYLIAILILEIVSIVRVFCIELMICALFSSYDEGFGYDCKRTYNLIRTWIFHVVPHSFGGLRSLFCADSSEIDPITRSHTVGYLN